jgi:hypothetical protein
LWLTPTATIAVLAFVPRLISVGAVDGDVLHRSSAWIFAVLVVVLVRSRPRVEFREPQSAWAQTVLRRSVRAAYLAWTGLFLAHAASWIPQFGLQPDLRHLLPLLLLLPFLGRSEGLTWASATTALTISFLYPLTATPTAALVGLLFVVHAYDSKRRRLFVGAVLAFHTAAWTVGWAGGPLPDFVLALNLVSAAILVVIAWRMRLTTAGLAAALVLAPSVPLLLPTSMFEWGTAALGAGFIALLLGFLVNWRERPQSKAPQSSVGSGVRRD